MKRFITLVLTAVLFSMITTAPVTAGVPATVTTGWYDTQLVKRVVLGAYYDQSYSTRQIICRRWRANPQARPFIKMALIAYRSLPSVSAREAARGVVKAFNSVCY